MIGQKIIRSRQDSRGNVIQKQPEGGPGRTRCMKCQCLCTTTCLANGMVVQSCSGCGANYVSTLLDAPKDPVLGVVPKRSRKPSALPA